jgi:hypothetical protein
MSILDMSKRKLAGIFALLVILGLAVGLGAGTFGDLKGWWPWGNGSESTATVAESTGVGGSQTAAAPARTTQEKRVERVASAEPKPDVPYGYTLLLNVDEPAGYTKKTVNGNDWWYLHVSIKERESYIRELEEKKRKETAEEVTEAKTSAISTPGATMEDLSSAENSVLQAVGNPSDQEDVTRFLYRGGPYTFEEYQVAVDTLRTGAVELKNNSIEGIIKNRDGEWVLVSSDPHTFIAVDIGEMPWASETLDELHRAVSDGVKAHFNAVRVKGRAGDGSQIWEAVGEARRCTPLAADIRKLGVVPEKCK